MVIARGQDEEEKSQPGHQAERLRDLHKKVVSMVAFLASVNEEIVGIV